MHCAHLPFVLKGQAEPGLLNRAARWIGEEFDQGRPVVVHCVTGVGRSPLTMAWFLARRAKIILAAAYQIVLSQRVCAEDRTGWLPPGWESWLRR